MPDASDSDHLSASTTDAPDPGCECDSAALVAVLEDEFAGIDPGAMALSPAVVLVLLWLWRRRKRKSTPQPPRG